MIAALTVVIFALAYAVVLLSGLASLATSAAPISDPWFTIIELLIVAMMPAIVTLMAAIRLSSPKRSDPPGRWSLMLIIMATALTTTVHIALLVLRRSDLIDPRWHPWLLSFEWPSVPYVLDVIAWDLFFGLAMLCAAPLVGGTRFAAAIRVTLAMSGVLALAGLVGPVTGDMRLRAIGIIGYAAIFPIAAALLAFHFRARIRLGVG